jgi:hypothetical protein
VLQLGVASLWLLDGVLQVQVFMFSRGFAQTVAQAAEGSGSLRRRGWCWHARPVAGSSTRSVT